MNTLARSGPPVECLLELCSPSTISRFVIAVIVDPINGMLPCWALAHVGEKVREFIPSFANLDAARSIPKIFGMVRIFTTLTHRVPSMVNRRSRFAMGQPSIPHDLAMQAPARAGLRPKSLTVNYSLSAADAAAMPECIRITGTVGSASNHRPSPKGLSYDID